MNIHVDNLAGAVTEDDLRHMFERYGKVVSVSVIRERDSKRAHGVVEMADDAAARAALRRLKRKHLKGRTLRLSSSSSFEPESREPGSRGHWIGPAMRQPGTGRGSLGEAEPDTRGSADDPHAFK